MKSYYKLNVEKCISISPSKMCMTTSVTKSVKNAMGYYEVVEKSKVSNDGAKLTRSFHEFELSKNSQRNLRNKIEYLFFFAKPRSIKMYNGRLIPKFKIGFITLTIPGKQIHNTGQVISVCLDNWLQIMRKRLNMKNYVWRLEFQANGNAHFHIVTDTYIDYYFAVRHWNKSLELLGYVSNYSNKMSKLSYIDYKAMYGKDYMGVKVSDEVLYKRYIKGKSTKWRNPNTVDCKVAREKDSISYYISKYFSKKEKGSKCNSLDNEDNSFAIRLCFWSRTLSKLKPESISEYYYDVNIWDFIKNDESVTVCYYDYCTVIYYDFLKLNRFIKDFLRRYFKEVQLEAEYVPA